MVITLPVALLVLFVIGVIVFFALKITALEGMENENNGKEVFFVKPKDVMLTVFSNEDANRVSKDFGACLATAAQANEAAANGAEWPYGGWTSEGHSVYPSGSTDRYANTFPLYKSDDVFGTISYERKTKYGLVTNSQAVGYMLYGKKPTELEGYDIVPWNCSSDKWSQHS